MSSLDAPNGPGSLRSALRLEILIEPRSSSHQFLAALAWSLTTPQTHFLIVVTFLINSLIFVIIFSIDVLFRYYKSIWQLGEG
jgi:hypothetical protein